MNKGRKRLAIIGSADLGQLIAHHATNDSQFTVHGFYDDFVAPGTATRNGKVLGPLSQFAEDYAANAFDTFLIGIGYKHLEFRWQCFQQFTSIAPIATLVHSSSYIDPTATIAPGCFILPGCTIDMNAQVYDNSLVNSGCCIAHDSTIGSNCFLGPGVTIAGFVNIEPHCFIGVATTVIDNISLTSGVQTGGGSVIIRSLEESGTYVGVPARRLLADE